MVWRMKKLLLLMMALVMVGCGTTGEYRSAWQEEMDAKWIPRVGHATYAQALTELGPPTSKEIDEGHTYASWRIDYVWHNSYTGKRTSKRKESLLIFGPDKLLKSVRFTHGVR